MGRDMSTDQTKTLVCVEQLAADMQGRSGLFAVYGRCTLPGDVATHTDAPWQPTCKTPTD